MSTSDTPRSAAQRSEQTNVAKQQRSGSSAAAKQSGTSEGPLGGPLDRTQITAPPLEAKSRLNRRNAWSRRKKSSEFLTCLSVEKANGFFQPPRPASCSWALMQGVSIRRKAAFPAFYSGTERCASIWACPVCSTGIRAGRSAEVQQAVEGHQAAGGDLVFFTGTVRHRKTDGLETTLEGVLGAWSSLVKTAAWKRKKKKWGISGYIRAIEVTYGKHGFHPHVHALLFLDKSLTEEELEEFKQWLFGYWIEAVGKAGARTPTEQGLNFQRVDKKGRVLAQYLSKVQAEKAWTVGAEMTRTDFKKGRHKDSLVPFQFLDDDSPLSEEQRGKLWREYYTVTKGRRAITWSQGLKDRYVVEEQSDEEILDGEKIQSDLLWSTTSAAYREMLKQGAHLGAVCLEHAECGEFEKLERILPRMVNDKGKNIA